VAKTHGIWTARWWSPTGLRSRWMKCARCSRSILKAARAHRDSFGEPAPVFCSERGEPQAAAGSSSSGTTARCVIVEGLLEEHRFLASGTRTARRFRECLPRLRARRPSKRASGPTRCMKRLPGMDLYEDALSWTPFRSTCTRILRGAAGTAASCRAWIPGPGAQAAAARCELHDLCRRQIQKAMKRLSCRATSAGSGCDDAPRNCEEALDCWRRFTPSCSLCCLRWRHCGRTTTCTLRTFLERCERRACAGHVRIIDFGLADRTNAVHDMAHAIERNIVEWLALTCGTGTSGRRACAPRSSARVAERL
jgi:hypothetical protein